MMSGEQRYVLVAVFAFIAIAFFLALVGAVGAEETVDNQTDYTEELVQNQEPNGSWDNDINTTTAVLYSLASFQIKPMNDFSWFYCDGNDIKVEENGNSLDSFKLDISNSANWTMDNYDVDAADEEAMSFIVMTDEDVVEDCGVEDFSEFQDEVEEDLISSQDSDGSWDQNVGDTAFAVYALEESGSGEEEAIDQGIDWILERKDEEEHSWGSIEDDSKAILALDSYGIDVSDEIMALVAKQNSDGSFGSIEETAWAIIALSKHPNKETMKSMDLAMNWLRSQDMDSDMDLAMSALAEQHHEDVKIKKNEEKGGFIPPPWLYILSILIIASLLFSYWLFARLDRNGALDGVRKDIYSFIAENPGEHMANITKSLSLSSSSTRYHLSVLEGMDKIVSHKNGKYKRYYINQNGYSRYTNGNGYKHIMSALKNSTARRIVKFLLSNPNSNQKNVSNALDIHPSTVNWHAKRLNEAEIISKERKGKEIVYSLNQDVQLRKVIGILEGSVA
jgi:predicted transcriptional regulator